MPGRYGSGYSVGQLYNAGKSAYATGQRLYGQYQAVQAAFAPAKVGRPRKAPVAAAIKQTALKSYLDKTYEKKCGVEVKQFLSADTALAPSTTLATLISPYQNIAQGLTDVTRLGNSIEVKKMKIHCNFTGHATLLSRVRIIVIKQSAMQGAVPNVADVLETTTNIKSYYALDNDSSYTILKDFTFEMTPLSTNDAQSQYTWKYTYKPKGCHSIRYLQADTTGVIADMIHGNINIKIMHDGGQPTGSFNFLAEWVDS